MSASAANQGHPIANERRIPVDAEMLGDTRRRDVLNQTQNVAQLVGDAIAHRPISLLPLVPHPQQDRMARVHKVDDANVGFRDVLTVQPAGVLL